MKPMKKFKPISMVSKKGKYIVLPYTYFLLCCPLLPPSSSVPQLTHYFLYNLVSSLYGILLMRGGINNSIDLYMLQDTTSICNYITMFILKSIMKLSVDCMISCKEWWKMQVKLAKLMHNLRILRKKKNSLVVRLQWLHSKPKLQPNGGSHMGTSIRSFKCLQFVC